MKAKQTGVMANSAVGGRSANMPAGNGVVQTNTGSGRWRPGMEQFVNAIKLKTKGDKI